MGSCGSASCSPTALLTVNVRSLTVRGNCSLFWGYRHSKFPSGFGRWLDVSGRTAVGSDSGRPRQRIGSSAIEQPSRQRKVVLLNEIKNFRSILEESSSGVRRLPEEPSQREKQWKTISRIGELILKNEILKTKQNNEKTSR